MSHTVALGGMFLYYDVHGHCSYFMFIPHIPRTSLNTGGTVFIYFPYRAATMKDIMSRFMWNITNKAVFLVRPSH